MALPAQLPAATKLVAVSCGDFGDLATGEPRCKEWVVS